MFLNKFFSKARVFAGVAFSCVTLNSHALFDDAAPDPTWANVDNGGSPLWIAYTYSGSVALDPEGGKTNDTTNGGASFSADVDISSGWSSGDPAGTCNPAGVGTRCGDKASAFYYYWNNGTPNDTSDDILYMRMRVNDDPQSASGLGFGNDHWNYLLDIEQETSPGSGVFALDGFKEIWFDVHGNGAPGFPTSSTLRVIYDDAASQDVPNDDGANAVTGCGDSTIDGTGTVVDTFAACYEAGLVASSICNDGVDEFSHTRKLPVSDEDPTDLTGEYFMDIQVPVTAIRDNTGCYQAGDYNDKGAELFVAGSQIVFDPSKLAFWFSTSNSGVDPLQKDYIGSGFGDEVPTPVTLKSFKATKVNGGVQFNWQTLTEVNNAGFNIYAKTENGVEQLNKETIYSKAVYSLDVIDYAFFAPVSDFSEFYIEEVAISGKSQKFGSFGLNKEYGDNKDVPLIDWNQIQQEHEYQAQQTEIRNYEVANSVISSMDFSEGQVVADIIVSNQGLQKIEDQDLLNLGVDLSGVAKDKIALFDKSNNLVALKIEEPFNPDLLYKGGFEQDVFERGDSVIFIADYDETLYTDKGGYQLRIGNSLGITRDNSSIGNEFPEYYMADLNFDQNNLYAVSSTSGDPWYNTRMLTSENVPKVWEFSLETNNMLEGVAVSELTTKAWGGTNYISNNLDHHMILELNDNEVMDYRFDGLENIERVSQLPSTLVTNGVNTVRITLPGDNNSRYDLINLESMKLSYPRQFVANGNTLQFSSEGSNQYLIRGFDSENIYAFRKSGNQVKQMNSRVDQDLANGGYQIKASAVTSPSDYYLATDESINRPQIRLHIAAELSATPNDLLVISHPDFMDAIQPLVQAREQQGLNVELVNVQDIYDNMNMGLADADAIRQFISSQMKFSHTKYVLLVGGDTYDYKNYSGASSISFIPSIYSYSSDIIRHVPLDPLYTDINGDRMPDAAIGRLPVRTVSELNNLVDKILTFPQTNTANDLLIAADEGFMAVSDNFINEVSQSWNTETVYLDQMSLEDARQSLFDGINSGKKLIGYFGHSGSSAWTFSGLFGSNDVSQLNNIGMPSTVMQWGCWNSYYVHPSYNTMSHAFLLSQDKGAAAVLGSTTLSYSNSQKELTKYVSQQLAVGGALIGDVMQNAKTEVFNSRPEFSDVLIGWILLGDPTMPFNN